MVKRKADGEPQDATVVTKVAKSASRARKTKKAGGSNDRLAPLENLPTELLQQIIQELDVEEYLAIKFVSRTTYNATISNDNELLDVQEMLRDRAVDNHYFLVTAEDEVLQAKARGMLGNILIALEAHTLKEQGPRTLQTLTCGVCASLKDHSPEGFDDKFFKKTTKGRHCINCIPKCYSRCCWYWRTSPLKVHDQLFFKCVLCTSTLHMLEARRGWQVRLPARVKTKLCYFSNTAGFLLCQGCADVCTAKVNDGTIDGLVFE